MNDFLMTMLACAISAGVALYTSQSNTAEMCRDKGHFTTLSGERIACSIPQPETKDSQ